MQELAGEVHGQLEQLERELAEIDLLVQQTGTEAERHEARRKALAERLASLEAGGAADDSLREARAQLLLLTRRAAVMEGQLQVLEGKQKALLRFQDFLRELAPRLAPPVEVAAGTPDERPAARALLAAQEEMRREIARRMHDGPAQSIANVALQAQVVQRLMEREPAQAPAEIGRLGQMVQHALEATKTFIFEIRPMVLDDLGLVATLRRASLEVARRSGVPVRFESVGPDGRLEEGVESALFRITQDALSAFVATAPAEVLVRLDWTEDQLRGTVQSRRAPADAEIAAAAQQGRAPDAAQMPPGLANILREKEEYEAERAAERERATALPDEAWSTIQDRAAALGLDVSLSGNGKNLAFVASRASEA
ncbi:MAG TPA: histidine kinase [Candidatus Limnocylindria bacterium]|nr:histidine kinase [Candidatus Limnocylindria bacterium]